MAIDVQLEPANRAYRYTSMHRKVERNCESAFLQVLSSPELVPTALKHFASFLIRVLVSRIGASYV
jgi:hypothetical protein